MKKYIWDYTILLAIASLVIGVDQWTKELVRDHLQVGEVWSPWALMTPYARIVHWKNSGAAFGMLQGFGGVFTVLAFIVAIAIMVYFPQIPRRDWMLRLALGLQLGGAVGNLIDRLTQGYVTDFISVGTFPVFNIADSSISVGVAILALGVWLKDWQEKRKPPASDPSGIENLGESSPSSTE
ncbi:MAG: signal peptidase II [Chloroflexota bacterium]